jgi:hypothetical protein
MLIKPTTDQNTALGRLLNAQRSQHMPTFGASYTVGTASTCLLALSAYYLLKLAELCTMYSLVLVYSMH